jgi:polyisoprenoid-binding protein YceI
MTLFFCLLSPAAVPSRASAQRRAIDPARSTITVYVFKSGFFSAFAHDHQIAAPITEGTVDESAQPAVTLRIESRSLRVLDPKLSAEQRAEVQKTMEGPEVLDVARHSEIRFQATAVEKAGNQGWVLRGHLSLHGQTRPVTVTVKSENGRYSGVAVLKQTDFGVKPVSIAGGTVRVKDEVRIEFQIALEGR